MAGEPQFPNFTPVTPENSLPTDFNHCHGRSDPDEANEALAPYDYWVVNGQFRPSQTLYGTCHPPLAPLALAACAPSSMQLLRETQGRYSPGTGGGPAQKTTTAACA